MLSHLVENHLRTDALSRDEVTAIGRLLITAGHETTADTIALSTALLLRYPTRWPSCERETAPAAPLEEIRFKTDAAIYGIHELDGTARVSG